LKSWPRASFSTSPGRYRAPRTDECIGQATAAAAAAVADRKKIVVEKKFVLNNYVVGAPNFLGTSLSVE